MSERDPIVAVTEADREAAADAMSRVWVNGQNHSDFARILDGRLDHHWSVKAFADHRATHAGEVERLREALRRIASSKTELSDKSDYARGWNDARFTMGQIARQALEASR